MQAMRPSSVWKQETHARLLHTLQVPPTVQRLSIIRYAQFVSSYSREMITKLAWQPIGALLLVAAVIVGPSFVTVNAAKGSLPGDALYPVKRSLERARISLTFSSTKRAERELNLVANRLHEIQRITKEQAPSPERKQKIAIALEELKKDTTTVKTRLEASKTEPQTSAQKTETLNLAKIIDAKTSGYQETLRSAVLDMHADNQEPSDDLGEAISTVQEVAINALDVLVSTKEDGELPISQEELRGKVEQQLTVTKSTADAVRLRLTTLIAAETANTATTEPVEVTETAPVLTFTDLLNKLDQQIIPTVVYAEELLKLGDFTAALDSLAKTNKQVEGLIKQIQSLPQPGEEVPVETPVEPATETPTPTTEQPPVDEPKSEAEPPAEEVPASNEPSSEVKTSA